jgi:hypothetical protein
LKKKQKLLPIWRKRWATRTPYKQKFFGSFSQKRTAFFLLPAALLVAIRHVSDVRQTGIS